LHARWEFIDFERGVIFLPDSKTGKKLIYLSAAALAVLSTLPHLEGLGDRTGQPRVDLKRPWTAVTKAARLEGLRIHDLRHSFASIGAGATPELARHAVTLVLLRALRLCDLLLMPWRRARPKQRELAPRSISIKIGITSRDVRDNYQRLSDDIAQTAQLVLPKNRKRYTKDVEIQRSHRPRPLAQFSSLCRKLGRNATSSYTAEGLGVLFYLGPGQRLRISRA
jgi:hypothetical protein